MKSIELGRIIDTGKSFQEKTQREFGRTATPTIAPASGYDILVSGLRGVETSSRMPNARIIPIGQNLGRLVGAAGKTFGIQIGNTLRPAVVTHRTTERGLHLTYLDGELDKLNPADPRLTDFQKGLLKKIRSLQHPSVGSHHSDGKAVGAELGHQQQAAASVLRPSLLQGAHAVHHWAESEQGIAGAVTARGLAVYDVRLDSGLREVREVSRNVTSGVLVDHPEFHEIDRLAGVASAQDFASGLSIVALESQLGIGNVAGRVLENLKRL